MNTLFFKYAIEVERTRSISQAAENLFMAQPNLSKAIKEMEDTLGFSIFKRSSKGVVPTPQGREFLVYARNIIAEIDKIETISSPDRLDMQTFKISIPRGSYIASGFTDFVAELDTKRGIDINVQETNSMQTITNVTSGKFNLGIIRYHTIYEQYFMDFISEKNLAYEPIWEFEYLALFSKKSPLANVPVVEYPMLRELTEIVHGDNIVPYLTNANKKKKDTETVKNRIYLYERCNQFALLSKIPTTYMWVSPIPEDLMLRYNLVQRKCIVSDHKYKDILIYPDGYKITELDKKFIDKLYEAKNNVAFKEYY